MITPFIQGFGTSAGLIIAIGAQNAFVLSQGVRKNHHFTIALICIVLDVIFISAGELDSELLFPPILPCLNL